MRTLYPFGWIDRDLKELGFLKEMSASAAKLYILYILAGGHTGRSSYSTKAAIKAIGLSNVTIYQASRAQGPKRPIFKAKANLCGFGKLLQGGRASQGAYTLTKT